jgi:hypothetical protein
MYKLLNNLTDGNDQQLLDYKFCVKVKEILILYNYFLWQMVLVQRFQTAVCEHSISIVQFNMNTPYWIMRAVRTNTRFNRAIRITYREDSEKIANVFLPKRYLSVFTDDDILKIKNGETKLIMMHHGRCERSGAFKLSLQTADV